MSVMVRWDVSGVEGTSPENAIENLNEMFKREYKIALENAQITNVIEEKELPKEREKGKKR